ncbi:Proton-dependent oligopeptide transporter family [Sesbania bispinosa]|nr:Proton-dependent oligopeptide transporter family [Sesbania bispinosa]
MACLELSKEGKLEEEAEEFTLDGSVDWHGRPAIRTKSGRWVAGTIILLNQGLATLAFFGVGVNLVLFLTRVMGQNNADAANNVSKWTGTVYIFSLVGAFLSDSYWGRYKTCAIFQVIFVMVRSGILVPFIIPLLLRPKGCGNESIECGKHSSMEMGMFYLSIYLIALGNGGYQPNIATFGADQFDEEHSKEGYSKMKEYGLWVLGVCRLCFGSLVLFLIGTPRYRHFKPCGNPLSRFCQVFVAASRKWKIQMTSNEEDLYVMEGKESSNNGNRKILHTHGFKFLDRAAFISSRDSEDQNEGLFNPWRLCPITQVEEVKKLKKTSSKGLTELQRMGIGLVIAVIAMVSAGIVECYRLKPIRVLQCSNTRWLKELWKRPLHDLNLPSGTMLVAYLLVCVMKISTEDHMPGWIPGT